MEFQSPQAGKSKKKKVLLAALSVLVVGGTVALGWLWYSQVQDYKQRVAGLEATSQKLMQDIDKLLKEKEARGVTTPESIGERVEESFFSLTLPGGFTEKTGARIFTFTAEPSEHYSYVNNDTGDYFEVNVVSEGSGVNPDYAWTYTATDGRVSLQKLTTEVCDASDELCTTSGDGRLDVFVKNEAQAQFSGKNVYFTFGNTKTETPTSLDFVDQIVDSLNFN